MFLLASFGTVSACQICLPMPTESLADRILAAEHLVLARENPDRPFTLSPVRSLRGEGQLPGMDLFLDSSTRRLLNRDEHLAVLCSWTPDREWRHLGVHDPTLAPVVAAILEHRQRWAAHPEERTDYFAAYLTHDDRRLRDLAHLEVAGAPYDQLRKYADRIPRERLLAELGNLRRFEWRALYILFLGQSGNPADQERIRKEVADAAGFGFATHLAAWATAYLEIDGHEAVDQLATWFGAGRSRTAEERKAVLAALTVHGKEGDPSLRDPIISLFGGFLDADPGLAPEIAMTLTDWQRPGLAGPVAALLRESPDRFDLAATAVMRRYVRSAAGTTEPGGNHLVPIVSAAALAGLALALGIAGRASRRSHPGRDTEASEDDWRALPDGRDSRASS